jgi:hypothetical protein
MEETEQLEQDMEIMAEQPATVEEAMWKKRYADLRRHSETVKAEAKAEAEALRTRYEQLAKGQIKLPKSEDEVIEWMGKYPEFAGILETIVTKRINDGQRDVNRRVEELETKHKELTVKEAVMKLKERHPDFDQLRNSEDFWAWLDKQSKKDKAAILENLDVDDAAFVIDKYKSQKKKAKPQGEDTDFEKEAAKVVRSGRGTQEISDDYGDYLFSESQIERESRTNPRWFEANEEKIMDAMRKGKILMDVSGGAR